MRKVKRGGGITEYEMTYRPFAPRAGVMVKRHNEKRLWTFEGGIAEGEIESTFVAWLEDPETRPTLAAGPDGEHSAEWFAERGLRLLGSVRKAIADGNADQAARHAMQLGEHCGRLELKQDWERPAMSGAKAASGAAEGGKKRTTADRDVEVARAWLDACDQAKADGTPRPSRATIGKRYSLEASAAMKAIGRGLRLIGAPTRK